MIGKEKEPAGKHQDRYLLSNRASSIAERKKKIQILKKKNQKKSKEVIDGERDDNERGRETNLKTNVGGVYGYG